MTGFKKAVAASEVLTDTAQVLARLRRVREMNFFIVRASLNLDIFLDHDGIGAGR